MRDFTGIPGATGGDADSDTQWPASVANAIVAELRNLVTHADGGNVALDPGNNHQVREAIAAMITGASGGLALRKEGVAFNAYASGVYRIDFPVPFPAQCDIVLPVGINSTGSHLKDVWVQIMSWDQTGFYFVVQNSGTAPDPVLNGVAWMAKGS